MGKIYLDPRPQLHLSDPIPNKAKPSNHEEAQFLKRRTNIAKAHDPLIRRFNIQRTLAQTRNLEKPPSLFEFTPSSSKQSENTEPPSNEEHFRKGKKMLIDDHFTRFEMLHTQEDITRFIERFIDAYEGLIQQIRSAYESKKWETRKAKLEYTALRKLIPIFKDKLRSHTQRISLTLPPNFFDDPTVWEDLNLIAQPWEQFETSLAR